MLRAYRLIITNNNPYAPENLWETEQPYIDNLSRSVRTFGHLMKRSGGGNVRVEQCRE